MRGGRSDMSRHRDLSECAGLRGRKDTSERGAGTMLESGKPMSTVHAILATVSDRPGMLFGLTKVLADHQANIRYVDMHTSGGHAEVYLEFSLDAGNPARA